MDHSISRSEKKRIAKSIEHLTMEIVALSNSDIAKLPCDDFLKEYVREAKGLKAGARKRQIKYITKQLRQSNHEQIMNFLAENKGSKLKEAQSFHELENLRDSLVTEAIEGQREATHFHLPFDSSWESEMIESICGKFPSIDRTTLQTAAIRYAKSRKPAFSREIFRMLKAAKEQQKFNKV